MGRWGRWDESVGTVRLTSGEVGGGKDGGMGPPTTVALTTSATITVAANAGLTITIGTAVNAASIAAAAVNTARCSSLGSLGRCGKDGVGGVRVRVWGCRSAVEVGESDPRVTSFFLVRVCWGRWGR